MQALRDHPDWVFIPPFNDKHIIAGQGTIALEILDQCPDVETIVVPIGGGGLASGVAFVAKTMKPSVRVIGVQMASCPSTFRAFYEHHKRPMPIITSKAAVTPLSDGIQVREPGELCLEIIYKYVDDVVVVTEDDVALAVALLAERSKLVVEGAGATPIAAILARKFQFRPDERIVSVTSGGNIQLSMFARCIDRALFLRNSRIALQIVLPYGTQHLLSLLRVFADHHAEVISCLSVPHVDTVANREKYTVIIDIASQAALRDIEQDCQKRGWPFAIATTNVQD
jgi:threonine dehydratase